MPNKFHTSNHTPQAGGVYQDSGNNKVEVKGIRHGLVYFEVLYTDDFRKSEMEDRIECLPLKTFTNRQTGFQCLSATGKPQPRLW